MRPFFVVGVRRVTLLLPESLPRTEIRPRKRNQSPDTIRAGGKLLRFVLARNAPEQVQKGLLH